MYRIGIDLGGTNIAAGICDTDYKILAKASTPTLAKRNAELIVKDMAELAESLIAKLGVTKEEIEYVGIAAPGTINSRTGVIEYSNNIKIKDFPVAEVFKRFFGNTPVYIANDANAAALGEAIAGVGKGKESLVMITLGTGVGGGVVINGKIFEGGVNSFGAELGHTVIVSGGRQCTCGRRGCFEAYASASALAKITEEKIYELKLKSISSLLIEEEKKEGHVTARTAFNAMKRGDKYACRIIEDYIGALADGITNMINIFQPEVLAIGGGVCGEGDTLMRPLCELVSRDQYTRDAQHKTRLVIAALGNDAGIVGAAALGNR